MAALVAWGTARLQVLHHGVAGLGEVGDVVVLEEGGGSAVDAHLVAFLDQALLPGARVPPLGAGVDRLLVGIVDQGPDERFRRIRPRRTNRR